ncbi:hypothetical protein [Streptomyces bohaiensis]|uniref:Molecular chaperone DnaJ n=1 Tax=Streptomyces bohaiensis TaxID=1431344 RepID=A0ABX1CDH9_9ACTN|nr:hypothetical protein [Streptomyces bohaiensis]NJQ14374.1 hypothetical protein [Streptomyces bohaiensis]
MPRQKTPPATTPPARTEQTDNDCGDCKDGTVTTTVRVGRSRRTVGEQTSLCLSCLGTGNPT